MGKKLNLLGAALAGAVALAATQSGAVTVPLFNNSFEAGNTGAATGLGKHLTFAELNTTSPGWDTYTGVQGWNTTSGNRIEIHSDFDQTKIDAQDGDYYISLDGGRNSSISQSVALTAGTYLLSFWYSPESTNVASNAISYSVGNLLNGVAKWGVNGAKMGSWTQITALFYVHGAGGNYDLSFGALGSANGVGGFLDNVSIAAVPVPAAGLGLLTALGGLAGLRRKRRAAV